MKKLLTLLEVVAALVIAVHFYQIVYIEISTYLNKDYGFLIPQVTYTYAMIAFFFILAVSSYVDNRQAYIFPILFLLVIVVILFLPTYFFATIAFLFVYIYKQNQNQPKTLVALSFIVLGYFVIRIMLLIGVVLLALGWTRYVLATLRLDK